MVIITDLVYYIKGHKYNTYQRKRQKDGEEKAYHKE